MTWPELRALFYSLLPDDVSSPVYVTLANADELGDTALKLLVESSLPIERIGDITTVATTATYSMPTDLLRAWRVTYDDEKILPTSKSRLRRINENWQSRSGTPRYYYLDEMNTTIGLYETPDTSDDTVQVFYSAEAMEVARDTNNDAEIAGISEADPGVVTTVADHGLADGDIVYIDSVIGMVEVNGLEFTVANKNDKDFELYGVDTQGYTSWSSGGKVYLLGEIELPVWAQYGVLYGMLGMAYEIESNIYNPRAAAFYWKLYQDVEDRVRIRSNSKLPKRLEMKAWRDIDPLDVITRLPAHIDAP